MRDNTDEAAQAADNAWSERMKVEIFGGNGCSYCQRAVALCISQGLPYVYKNIDDDEEYFDQLVGRIKTWKTVPQIFIGAEHIGGFDELSKRYPTDTNN